MPNNGNKNNNNKNNENQCCRIIFVIFKEKFLYSIFKEKIYLIMIFIIILLHSYYFFNIFLFSDKYISVRYSKEYINFAYIIADTYHRINHIIIISFFILRILKWILDIINLYPSKILKIIISIFLTLLQLFYFYFIHIFLNINSNSENVIIISTIISLVLYLIFYSFILLIISLMKWISNIKNIECLSYIMRQIDTLL